MNKIILIGRLTKDPEITWGGADNEITIANYTLAVDKRSDDEANFIRCRAIGAKGDFAEKYLKKGMKIAVEGELTVDSWTDSEGSMHWMTYVLVSSHEFCEPKKEGGGDNGGNKTGRSKSGSRSRK